MYICNKPCNLYDREEELYFFYWTISYLKDRSFFIGSQISFLEILMISIMILLWKVVELSIERFRIFQFLTFSFLYVSEIKRREGKKCFRLICNFWSFCCSARFVIEPLSLFFCIGPSCNQMVLTTTSGTS